MLKIIRVNEEILEMFPGVFEVNKEMLGVF